MKRVKKPPLYQWDQWFQLGAFVVERAQHYQRSQATMVQMIRNEASKRKLTIALEDLGDRIAVVVTGTSSKESDDVIASLPGD